MSAAATSFTASWALRCRPRCWCPASARSPPSLTSTAMAASTRSRTRALLGAARRVRRRRRRLRAGFVLSVSTGNGYPRSGASTPTRTPTSWCRIRASTESAFTSAAMRHVVVSVPGGGERLDRDGGRRLRRRRQRRSALGQRARQLVRALLLQGPWRRHVRPLQIFTVGSFSYTYELQVAGFAARSALRALMGAGSKTREPLVRPPSRRRALPSR